MTRLWKGCKVPHPEGVQDDASTWKVHPKSSTIRDAFAFKQKLFCFDGRVASVFCELNTRNANLFLNSFRPKEGDRENESSSAKAQNFMTVNLLGMKFAGTSI